MKRYCPTSTLVNFIVVLLTTTCVTPALGQIPPDGIRVILHEFARCGTGAKVVARQDVDLASDAVINALIQRTIDDYKRECPSQWSGLRGFTIRAYYQRNESGFTPDLQMVVNKDGVVTAWNYRTAIDARNQKITQAKQEVERRAREEAQAREEMRRQQAQRNTEDLIQAFADKHGAAGWVKWDALNANPFAQEGKIFVFNAEFKRMVSPSSGLFGSVLVTDVPGSAFTRQGPVLIAGKVVGSAKVKNEFGGETSMPQVKYLGHMPCGEDLCRQYYKANLRSR